MKMKFRGVGLAALLLSASNITLADQGTPSAVGDLPGYGEEAYFAEEATYAPSANIPSASIPPAGIPSAKPIAATAPARQYISSDPIDYPPVGVSQLRQVGHRSFGAAGRSSCDRVGCDSGCDSAHGKRGRFGSILSGCSSDTWATAEFLMWFTPNRSTPALVTTSDPGTLPILPLQGAANPNNVATVFGDPIQGEISGGFRGDYGKFITDRVGIGGRFWVLAENDDSYIGGGDGTNFSIGRPFFNTNTNAEDSLLVALAGTFTGSVEASSSLNIMALEAYSRIRFGCAKNAKLDFLAGYSYFDIDDTLSITSTTITNATARTRTYNDFFSAGNKFNGGQTGFEMVMNRGRWTVRSLTKVHLGNMEQTVRIGGNSSDQTAPAPAVLTSGGLLAMGNQGSYERNVFAFVPEANFKLGYRFRDHVTLSVGYSFIYFDNVALTGDVVDRSVDGTTLNTGVFASRPAFNFDDSSLWVQGIDLGVIVDF